MNNNRQTFRRSVLGAALALATTVGIGGFSASALADASFPSKPIKLVVGFPPGGSNDIVARIIAVPLGEQIHLMPCGARRGRRMLRQLQVEGAGAHTGGDDEQTDGLHTKP